MAPDCGGRLFSPDHHADRGADGGGGGSRGQQEGVFCFPGISAVGLSSSRPSGPLDTAEGCPTVRAGQIHSSPRPDLALGDVCASFLIFPSQLSGLPLGGGRRVVIFASPAGDFCYGSNRVPSLPLAVVPAFPVWTLAPAQSTVNVGAQLVRRSVHGAEIELTSSRSRAGKRGRGGSRGACA